MPRYELHTYKVAELDVHSIDADSSGEALQQFSAEVQRIQAVGQAKYGVGHFLVELLDENGRKVSSVSVHKDGPSPPA